MNPLLTAAARAGRPARGLGRAGAAGLGVLAPGGRRAWCPTWCCSSWWPPASRTAPSSGWCSASAPGCCSTSRRRPTTYAGRWALALMVVGYVAGRLAPVGPPARRPVAAAWPRRAAFVGTSVFALTGLLLRDPAVGVGELLRVEVVALCLGRRARPGRRTPHPRTVREGRARPGPGVTALDRREPQPAAAGGDPGAGLLAVRDAAGPALLPAGRQRRRVRRPGRLAVDPRDRRPAAARADRRRRWAGRWSPTAPRGWSRSTAAPWPSCPRTSSGRCCTGSRGSPTWPCRGSTGCSRRAATTRPCRATAGTGRRSSRCRSRSTCPSRWRCGCSSSPRTSRASPPSSRACAPTRAVRHQRRAPARLPQPDHRRRVRPGQGGRRPVRQRRVGRRSGRRREGVRRVAARDARLPRRSRSTRWAG